MAKKSQTKARRSNTRTGKQLVNFYNNGTVNIDARHNNSRSIKHENNGCTIHISNNAVSESEQSEILLLTEKAFIVATRQLVEFMVNGINLKKNI